VQSLVEAHGGRVSLTSRPGATTFTIRLPRHLLT
jgi:two-component system OmpR family sensor kinase